MYRPLYDWYPHDGDPGEVEMVGGPRDGQSTLIWDKIPEHGDLVYSPVRQFRYDLYAVYALDASGNRPVFRMTGYRRR